MITELFCAVDDFLKLQNIDHIPALLSKKKTRKRASSLNASEIITIQILFHCSGYRNFKHFYLQHVCKYMHTDFNGLVSYSRFIQLLPRVAQPMALFLNSILGKCSGISIVDSTPIIICHNKRIKRNKVFKGLAEHSCSTMGWFFGFKLHLITNDKGDLLAVHLTKGNVDDRKPVPKMAENILGKLFGDKGYLSKDLSEKLREKGVQLVTTIRKNMKNRLMPWLDKIMVRKRFIIETINDKLKNECQIEHTRHRSPINFAINLLAGLICYQRSPKKPSLNLPKDFSGIAIA